MNAKQKGFTRYLEHQFGLSGGFYEALWAAIRLADEANTTRLAEGFPHEVEAYRVFTQVGIEEFLVEVDQEDPLAAKLTKRMMQEREPNRQEESA